MEHKKLYLSVVLLFALGLTRLNAQESVNVSGDNALGSGGSVSYSVGQVVYTTNSGTTGTVSQGVQQPYEISVITGFEDIKWMNLNCSVYPNPTTDYLTLKIDASASIPIRNLSYQLYDMNGRLLESGKLESYETQIVMVNLVPETYLLEVFDQNKIVKSFKIIKRSL
ncbi:MAG: T9SS type A sorting domain-containing protein [Prolixibacteraceae bacterium]|nr:T9SS type A sorting domain-containing protein [Prolixibacteraceae bacterium]